MSVVDVWHYKGGVAGFSHLRVDVCCWLSGSISSYKEWCYTCFVYNVCNFLLLMQPKCLTIILSNAWFAIILICLLIRLPP
jgi:hypothetical protein